MYNSVRHIRPCTARLLQSRPSFLTNRPSLAASTSPVLVHVCVCVVLFSRVSWKRGTSVVTPRVERALRQAVHGGIGGTALPPSLSLFVFPPRRCSRLDICVRHLSLRVSPLPTGHTRVPARRQLYQKAPCFARPLPFFSWLPSSLLPPSNTRPCFPSPPSLEGAPTCLPLPPVPRFLQRRPCPGAVVEANPPTHRHREGASHDGPPLPPRRLGRSCRAARAAVSLYVRVLLSSPLLLLRCSTAHDASSHLPGPTLPPYSPTPV